MLPACGVGSSRNRNPSARYQGVIEVDQALGEPCDHLHRGEQTSGD